MKKNSVLLFVVALIVFAVAMPFIRPREDKKLSMAVFANDLQVRAIPLGYYCQNGFDHPECVQVNFNKELDKGHWVFEVSDEKSKFIVSICGDKINFSAP